MNGECWLDTKQPRRDTQNSRPRPIRHIVGIASVGICLVGGSKCVIVRRAAGRVIRRIRAVNSAIAHASSRCDSVSPNAACHISCAVYLDKRLKHTQYIHHYGRVD